MRLFQELLPQVLPQEGNPKQTTLDLLQLWLPSYRGSHQTFNKAATQINSNKMPRRPVVVHRTYLASCPLSLNFNRLPPRRGLVGLNQISNNKRAHSQRAPMVLNRPVIIIPMVNKV